MKKKSLILGMVVMVLFIGMGIAGCSEKPEEIHVAIVNGACANSAHINPSKAKDSIVEACESYGSVHIIMADGKPFQSAEIDIPDQSGQGLSGSKRKEILDSQAKQIIRLLKESQVKSEEVDLLLAIDMAARALNAAGNGVKEMLVSHSGLSTQGVLDFTQEYLGSCGADDVLAYLKEEEAIPDLEGIHVTWIGLGDTAAPQPELSSKDRAHLMEVWEKILKEAGAQVEFAKDLPMETEADETLPKVSIVEILQPASAISEVISDDFKAEETTFVLDEETVNFKPGSEELLSDEDEVRNLLQGLITYMLEHPSYQVLLAGTTASAGTQEELVVLSEKRCNTIREIFLKSGVSEEQVKTVGLGYQNHPYYILDTDENGELIEEIARRNRAVIIMPIASDAANTLMSGR